MNQQKHHLPKRTIFATALIASLLLGSAALARTTFPESAILTGPSCIST